LRKLGIHGHAIDRLERLGQRVVLIGGELLPAQLGIGGHDVAREGGDLA
jgi:hypothetical protein